MSGQEEQDMEIEALESIYPEEIEILSDNPTKVKFSFKTENYEDEEYGASIEVSFKFTPNYPDELPEIEILEIENYEDKEGILKFMKDIGEENSGMPMIYTIASALVEKLNKDTEERKQNEERERDRIMTEKEEEEMRRYEGNKVTVEVFLKWKMAFDKEMELKKNQTVTSNKPTGKQLFETNESLFRDVETNVEVDEALFQSIDDLDLDDADDDVEDDDDDEDEDWVPED